MSDGVAVAVYVLSSMGLTVLAVWPTGGPGAWVRDRVLRRALPAAARGGLDCYICFGTWVALAAAPFWWAAGYRWAAVAWPAVPAAFWLALVPGARPGE